MKNATSTAGFVVLGGSGAIGRIVVRDLFESDRANRIVVADFNGNAATAYSRRFRSTRVTAVQADARQPAKLAAILKGHVVVINCTRHQFNLDVMQAALQARIHYLDLGGLFDWTRRQLRLNRRFVVAGLTAILGMGCAPGLTNVMAAELVSRFDHVDSIRIRVGGKDFNAQPGFFFPYSAQTIVEELTLAPWKWSRGKFVKAVPRTGWERVEFGPPVGDVWCVMTRHSEIATLPLRFRSRALRYADFKVGFDRPFVREILRRLRSGQTVRDFEELPTPRSAPNDYEITRVVVTRGRRSETIDCHARSRAEWNASAGDIDTACPASIVAQMIASGEIRSRGVFAPEDVVPATPLFDQLAARGLAVRCNGSPRSASAI
jgi:saccharopine dehydrogenase-like NADP-dependent oxidoreductase